MIFSVLLAIIMIHLRSHLPLRPSSTSLIQLSVQSLLVTQRTDSKLQHSLYNRCYQYSLTTFQHSLQQLNDPAQLAHYYTSIGDDSGIWARLNARIGYYSMTNAIFQTAILHRLYRASN